jgi:peptide/nickel transport system substrate-binding protein
MMGYLGAFAMAAPLLVAVATEPALAQKSGGVLKMYSPDSPASVSIHEEATFVAEGPMMGVFNILMLGKVPFVRLT